MHGVPQDLPLGRFVGDFVSQVSLGTDAVHFHFGKAGTISVEGTWQLQDSAGRVVDQSMAHADRDAYRLHVLFNADVTGYTLDPPRSFSLAFVPGHVLTVYDDTPQYESFHIEPDGIHV